MLARIERPSNALRPFSLVPNIAPNAMGSVLVEYGNTKIICAVTLEEKTPHWMKKQGCTHNGWITAEYALLPYATLERKPRECVSGKRDSRSVEIQRFIGRSMRAITHFHALEGHTLWIDCDVLQADGGTRTASVSGAYVAAQLAIHHLLREGKLKTNPFMDSVGAVSVGICDGQALLDLNYAEDSAAEVDLNVVMNGKGHFIEIQGTAEKTPFSNDQLNTLLDLARVGIEQIQNYQEQFLKNYLPT
ncbi:MAG: ribonuclease PH [Puniceicoccales bacterium]|jgi:ribonuclease PH|nr:ribonuclease PH [Puniceicoccales bacterium]